MRNRWIAAWARRRLPPDIHRSVFTPALWDARGDLLRGLAQARGWRRWLVRVRYAAAVTTLVFCCSRLASRPRPPSARKEYLAMFARDLRHACRLFVREPAFSATIVLTLALGIGANASLFALVEAVLLRKLPYPEADALAIVRHRDVRTGISKDFIAIGDFVDLHARQRTLQPLAGFGGFTSTLLGEGESLRVEGLGATPELFGVLGITPGLGRPFADADVGEGAPPVVIISHRLWETRFGSDPQITSRSAQFGATRRMIVGVAPRGFSFPPGQPTDVVVPIRTPVAAPAQRKAGWIFGVGRLAGGATIPALTAELDGLAQQFEREHPDQNQGSRYYAVSLRDSMVGDTKRPLLILFAAVGFVLLIACVNVGNLLLARSLARHNEMALRLALGAGRARLCGQIVTEGLVLALAGGLVGVAIAWRAVPVLAGLVPRAVALPALEGVAVNAPVLLFSLAVSIVSALLFSGVAWLAIGRGDGGDALRSERRTTMSPAARRGASSLMAAEVALAVMLLMAAGLTLRSFANLIAVDPGFRAEDVVTLQLQLPPGRYDQVTARRVFYRGAFAALEDLREIETIGAGVVTPLTGNNWTVPFERVDRPVARGERPPDVGWQSASAGYFKTLQIPLRTGRLFDASDGVRSDPVVIVSEGIVQRFFPGEEAVGRRVRIGDGEAEIVGVVGDIRRAALTDEPRADMYFPFEQQPSPSITLFARVAGDTAAAIQALRAKIKVMEPLATVFQVRELGDVAAESVAVPRLAMRLLAGFAAVALLLSAIGIYGVMSYSVSRRARELGTRLALGADRADIVRLVLREAGAVALVGLAAGVASGLVAVRSLQTLLFGVTPWDPLALTAAVSVLAAAAMAASYLPARRAGRIDPARTLAAD